MPHLTLAPRRALPAAALALVVLAGCVVAPPPQRSRPAYAPQGRAAAPPPVAAAPMYFYPERAQAEPQQERDRYECYRWAVRESGTDPGMTTVRQPYAEYQPLPPQRNGAEVVAGAATGAVVGAALSSPRHAGGGAVIGAIFGATLGAAAQESRAQAIEQSQARQQAAVQAANAAAQLPSDNFRRAISACMQGRGYRIG